MKKLLSTIVCLILGVTMMMAQTKTITGTVTSAEDGEPIIGASVIIPGTQTGTVTDLDGNFSLKVPEGTKVLRFSYVGMQTQDVSVKNKMSVSLSSDNQVLDDVVVTAQGLTRKDKSIGYAAQKVDGEKLTMARQTDLGNSLAGKVAGARFIGASGAKFDAGTIILRGTSSFNDEVGSEPIYVVDGTITNKNAVNMDDVASINVLKGAAATALYGSQGGNGAIIITTKGGAQDDKGHIEVSHTMQFEKYYNHFNMQKLYGGGDFAYYGEAYGSQEKYKDVDTMSPEWLFGVYGEMENEDGSYYYNFGEDQSWGPRYDKNVLVAGPNYYDPTSSMYHKATPWVFGLDLADLYRTGLTNTTNVSFSKSGKDYNARISFTNTDRQGIQQNSNAVRRYLSTKINFKPTKWLNVTLDHKFTYRNNHNAAIEGYSTNGNIYQEFLQWGNTNVNLKDYKDYLRPDGSWRTWNSIDPDDLTANFHDNPYATMDNYNRYSTEVWNVISGDTEVLLPFNIKAGFRFMGNIKSSDSEYKYGSGSINFNPYYGETQYHTRDLTFQGRLTWGDRFFDNKLSVDAAAFIEQENYNYGTLSANTTDGLIIPGFFNLSATNGNVSASNSETHYKVRSVYGTVTLGYDDTYYLDGSIRNDWDSRLPVANNSYLYYGLSASVMLNQFIKDKAPWLNYWKLRASAAQVGSTLGAYSIYPTYSTTKWNTITGQYAPTTLRDPNIKPTISTSYEVGTEFRLFNNRLHGDINFYTKDTKNQIISANTPSASGYSSRQVNAGLVRNRGVEISLGGSVVKTRDFQWDVDVNLGKNKNTLVELYRAGTGDPSDDMTVRNLDGSKFYYYWYLKAEEGKPVGNITTMARWKKDEQGNYIVQKTTSSAWGGGYSPVWETGVEKEVGNYQPDWIGGFSTDFRYKNFRLGASFDFSVGGKIVSWSNMWGMGSGIIKESALNNDKGVNEREPVTKDGGVHVIGVDKEGAPVDCYMNAYQYYHYTTYYDLDRWVYDRTYLKMREITFGYDVPRKWLASNKLGLSNASISFVATNPWVIYSAVPNIDVSESGSNWLEGGQTASTRSFGFTVKLGF